MVNMQPEKAWNNKMKELGMNWKMNFSSQTCFGIEVLMI